MLRAITLINWRSHAHTRIPLSGGANLLIGPMGSGKSSLMDALCFALYGTYPKLTRREVRLEEVANFRHADQPVSVEVEWDDAPRAPPPAGRLYRVRRELQDGQAWLYIDGKMVQKGPRAVSEEVERLLDLPYDLFSRAVYSEQNRLDAWLTLSPSLRKAELDRLLGLDRFEAARAACLADYNRERERAAAAEAAVPLERLEAEKKALDARRAQLAQRQSEREALAREQTQLASQTQALQAEWERAERARKEREDLLARSQRASGTAAAMQKLVDGAASLPPLGELEEKARRFGAERARLEAGLRERQTAQTQASRRAGELSEQLRAEQTRASRQAALLERQSQLLAGKSIEALKTELATLKTELEALLAQTASLERERADTAQVLKTLRIKSAPADAPVASHPTRSPPLSAPLGDPVPTASAAPARAPVCPVCHQALDEAHRLELERANTARQRELESRLSHHQTLIANERRAAERLSGLDAEVSRLQAQLSALGAPLDAAHLQTEQEESRRSALALASALEEQQRLLARLQADDSQTARLIEQARQLSAWKSAQALAAQEAAALQTQAAASAFDESAHQALKARREDLLARSARSAEALRSIERLLEQDGQLVRLQEQMVESLALKRSEAQAARVRMDELGAFGGLLRDTQARLREHLLSGINSALARLWPLLYPYGDWERVRLVASERDYSVEIYQNDWKPLEAHASGGERACLGLALRTALSVLLTPQLGWLILDEPTHNLDARAVQGLGRALAEALPRVIPQVIVITHENQLVESTPGRVIRFSRDKLKGEDTRVEIEGVGASEHPS